MRQVSTFVWPSLLLSAAFVVFCGSVFASGPNDAHTSPVVVAVLDEKNQPVPDATVEVRSDDKFLATSATDSAGKVNLSLPGVRVYALTVSKKGYLTTGTTVEVGANNPVQNVDIVMSSTALGQQSITVTGEPTNPVAETEGSRKTLPLEQAKISSTRPATLTDTLPLIPGIVRAKDGSVRIAGFGEDHSALWSTPSMSPILPPAVSGSVCLSTLCRPFKSPRCHTWRSMGSSPPV